ncbi:hypothetical protein HanIR_Chr05g0250611 [Helianthus annuus]|nr:hypothetical protein HanIR_Chr05g0250611 [Helianthus annuus]
MDAREWNESLDQIISTIAEMIDLLKNESRRWATSPIFSTPLPSPATDSPPPTVTPTLPSPPTIFVTAPRVPSPVPPPPPKQACSTIPLAPKLAPTFSRKPISTTIETPTQKQAPRDVIPNSRCGALFKSISDLKLIEMWCPSQGPMPMRVEHTSKSLSTLFICYGFVSDEETDEVVTGKREWRPPWRLVMTAPNDTGQTEWRPPWSNTKFFQFHLKDKVDSSMVDCYVPSLNGVMRMHVGIAVHSSNVSFVYFTKSFICSLIKGGGDSHYLV